MKIVHPVILAVPEGAVCTRCGAVLPASEIPEGEWYRGTKPSKGERTCDARPAPKGALVSELPTRAISTGYRGSYDEWLSE